MNCEECGAELVRVYTVEEVEEEFKGASLAAMQAQLNLLRQMRCPECGSMKVLSALEIVKEFKRLKSEGKIK